MVEKLLFLKSGKCAWGKCIFCGYGKIYGNEPTFENLKKEFDKFFDSLLREEKVEWIKIFGSGSFLDENQIPKKAREYFINSCIKIAERIKLRRVTIESRPEFVTKEKVLEFMRKFKPRNIELDIAIGLEVADDKLLKKLRKGFSLKDYENATKIIHECGAKVRTYLLVNIPFLSKKEMIKKLEQSVEYALKFSDSVVLINLLPHKNSELFDLWLKGEWNFLSKEEFRKLVKKWSKNAKIEIDEETFRFIPQFPKEKKTSLKGTSETFLIHPHFEIWQDYLVRWYSPPSQKDILLFLPCSYKKPYSTSKTHKRIIEILRRIPKSERVHEVMISNAGVVPREFEDMYPFNAYDWDEKKETLELKKRYVEVTSERIKRFLKAHKRHYKKILCFLKYDSESYKALKIACDSLKLEFKNLLNKETYEKIRNLRRPLQSDAALKDFEKNIKSEIH